MIAEKPTALKKSTIFGGSKHPGQKSKAFIRHLYAKFSATFQPKIWLSAKPGFFSRIINGKTIRRRRTLPRPPRGLVYKPVALAWRQRPSSIPAGLGAAATSLRVCEQVPNLQTSSHSNSFTRFLSN
jgi:hypothetical protein